MHFLLKEEDRHPFTSSVSLCYDKKGKAVEDNLSTLLPAGSNTYMSLSDFIKFGQMFLKKDGVLMKKETLELMETLDLEEPIDQEVYNVGFGLIHQQYDMGEQVGKILGHGGNTTCHHSMFNYIPELDVGIVVMTNSQRAIGFYATVGMTVLVEYLKEKGIAVGGSKVEQEHVKCDSANMVGKYATGLGMMEIKQNNKNELVTKVSKIPIRLCLCKDGYYQCMPVKAIHKIPIFKSSIQGMRLRPAAYMGEDIMLFEQADKYHKTKGVIGCKYEQTDIPDCFRAACGNYMIADEMFKDIKCKCQLKVEGEVLMLEIAALNVKLNSCLKVVGEDLAILQGFGRLAREMVKLQKRDGILKAALAPYIIQPTTFAEINGNRIERLDKLSKSFKKSKVPYQIVKDMQDWQLCHLAMVVPIADAYYMAKNAQKAWKESEVMKKTAVQMKNNFQTLHKSGITLSPSKMNIFRLLPTWIIKIGLTLVFKSNFGEVFMYQHSMNAPDEMRTLHEQFYGYLGGK